MEDRIRGSLTRKELPANPGNYGTTIPNEPETVRQFHAGGSLHDKTHDNPGDDEQTKTRCGIPGGNDATKPEGLGKFLTLNQDANIN
ncbi:Uncharacterized protein HZ326_3666 [Fusarium oxysporum f. sp. albedinis]|nr:Uncharacterized protein HZ326_3666 [Fusarium oxysporum f. sp. albedinis]